jgi:hypothetical protein
MGAIIREDEISPFYTNQIDHIASANKLKTRVHCGESALVDNVVLRIIFNCEYSGIKVERPFNINVFW